ncbi:sensory rhodopsin transducer [Asticcacaulis taihuensis]|jgi:hypothetical protein|uniref:sensory rhodopsin transducer n=1 Tax=Asticcacaulis taihuensis TaxID=260084 RepID=UPI0026EFD310|nr:sensory rhodopsin transducer [Asticcacaulis taihuensis]
MTTNIGRTHWAIAEGYIPPDDQSKPRAEVSHEACCILNAGDTDAHIEITIYFGDRGPVGPYRLTLAAQRTNHLRFNDLHDPEPIPKGTDYASTIISDVPIVVQHTRLDSRLGGTALLSTTAYSQ